MGIVLLIEASSRDTKWLKYQSFIGRIYLKLMNVMTFIQTESIQITEEMAEYTFMIVLPTLAAFNLVLPICGIISSAIYPIIFGNGIWPKDKPNIPSINLLDIFTIISSVTYLCFHGELRDTIEHYPADYQPNFRFFRVSVAFAMTTTIFYLIGLLTTLLSFPISILQKSPLMTIRDFIKCIISVCVQTVCPLAFLCYGWVFAFGQCALDIYTHRDTRFQPSVIQ